jgi:hypothetical protein
MNQILKKYVEASLILKVDLKKEMINTISNEIRMLLLTDTKRE